MTVRSTGKGKPQTDEDFLVRFEGAAMRVGTRRILRGTDWTLRRGEQWLIWGANGAGKSTLAGAVTGGVPVVEGRRVFGGPGNSPPSAAWISLDEHVRLVAREDLRDLARGFAGDVDGQVTAGQLVGSSTSPEAGVRALDRVGIASLADQPIRTLSTGEMRKLLIARALSLDPELLVLDEAFDGLDAASRRQFAALVDRLMGEGLQMLVISHRRSEIPAGISHVVALDAGRIVFAGPLSEWRGRDLETPGLGEIPEDRLSTLHCEASGGEEIIRLEGVTVRYGGRIVFRDLDWKVRSGENWMLSGPNGAGKTTLVRLVSGDHPQAYSNRIFLFGRRRGSGETIWEIRNRIGLVSADLQVRYRRQLIGLDVVASGFFDSIGLYRRAAKSQYEQASRWMARLCIPHLAEPRFDRMSTGERRMVLLARAMVKKPDLLILDEPCQGLDARHRRCFLDVVDRIAACSSSTLLYITHHGDERPRCISHELHLPPA